MIATHKKKETTVTQVIATIKRMRYGKYNAKKKL